MNLRFRPTRVSALAITFGVFGSALAACWMLGTRALHSPMQYYDAELAASQLTPDSSGGAELVPSDQLSKVSLVCLIATPERYHGKAVRVCGFLRVKFEGTAIYLGRDDADYLNVHNGLWVSFGRAPWKGVGVESAQFDGKYVLIEGVFDREYHGHLGQWPGALHSVWRVMELTKYYR